jgi:hypothetical protein
VAEIVQPNTLQSSPPTDQGPWPLQVGPRLLRIVAGDDVFSAAGQIDKDGAGGASQHDRLLAGLGIRKKQQSALEIDVIPL